MITDPHARSLVARERAQELRRDYAAARKTATTQSRRLFPHPLRHLVPDWMRARLLRRRTRRVPALRG